MPTSVKDYMSIKVRCFEPSDIPVIVQAWNRHFFLHPVKEDFFRWVVLGDENYVKESVFVAEKDGVLCGFACCAAREGVAGKDGRGRPREERHAFLKAMFVTDEAPEAAEFLLDKFTGYVKSMGKSVLKVIEYTGPYFFPGIEERYEKDLRIYENTGFYVSDTIRDMSLELKDYEPGDYQKESIEKTADAGGSVKVYEPEMVGAMKELAEKTGRPQWFPPGWEEEWSVPRDTVVCCMGDQIVGYANYQPDATMGRFGTTYVIPEFRGKGVGTAMLNESMLQLKAKHTPRVLADWANAPFYERNGWECYRKYKVFRKDLD